MKKRPIRALTLYEEVIIAKGPTDIWLPDDPRAAEEAIDRLARTEVPKKEVRK